MLISVNGIELNVEDSGTGPAVLLVHGFPDSSDVWRHQVPALTAAGYRVITMDLRGFGESDKPVDVAAYRAEEVIADIAGVLDHFGIERVHLVAHDWGSVIAWVFAAALPARLASLTCMSTGHPASYRAAGWEQRQKGWYTLLFQFDVAGQWLLQDGERNLREFLAEHPDADRAIEKLRRPGAVDAALGLYRAWAPPESLVAAPAAFAPIPVPVMGLWSSGDRFLTEGQMTGSASYVSGPFRYERVEGAGHWLLLDEPQKVTDLLLDFIGQHVTEHEDS